MNTRPATRRHRFLRRHALLVLVSSFMAVWTIGQIFRDRSWLTGLCFYVPTPVVGPVLLGAAWSYFRDKRRAAAGLLVTMALVPGYFLLVVENHWFPRAAATRHVAGLPSYEPPIVTPSSSASDSHGAGAKVPRQDFGDAPLRLLHWNVCWGDYGWAGVERVVTGLAPDLVVLSERPRYDDTKSLLALLGPEFRAYDLRKTTAIARGDVVDVRQLVNSELGEVHDFEWHFRGRSSRIMTVDLVSDIRQPRDPMLAVVNRLIQEHAPDIVVGDFNAPRRSQRLSALPGGYRHAYDVVGSGWGYTWPMPLPVYALDQCILGPRIAPVHYELRSSRFSDHRLQWLLWDLAAAP